jgi:signal transduction histidine kinase/CheY-like chemotaxis protein
VVVSTSRVIVVDPDGALMREIAGLGLGSALEVRRCASAADAERERGAEVLIAAAALGEAGPELLSGARRADPDGFRILAAGDPGRALRALNEGCADAVLIDHDPERLRKLIHDGCEAALTRRHWRALIDELAGDNGELTSLSQRLQVTVEERTATLAQAQQLLKQQQEELVRLETQAVVSQLVRGLAHELNNPLAAILGYSQRLRRTWAKDEDAARRLDVILGEVERCRSLVEQLRNLAAPLEEEPVASSPGSLLLQAAERIRESGQAVPDIIVEPDVPAVLAAPHALVRVFEQVLDNATLAGAHTCWLSGSERDGRVRLRLENDGATPDDATVRNATRPFYTTMASKGRRGLGLAIATSLLREQSGNLELAQREGFPGAACIIALPARPAPAPAVEPRASARGGTVLVVDDEPLVAELLLDALEEGGLAGRVVGSVAEAVQEVQRAPLRALIVDVRLPDGSGVDLARRALELRPELTGHIALITGSGEDWGKLGIPANAKWPVLGKPFRLEQIAKLVQSIA